MKRFYKILGACSGWGAQIRDCEQGPEVLLEAGLFEDLKAAGLPIGQAEMIHPRQKAAEVHIPLPRSLPLIHEFNLRLAQAVSRTIDQGEFPLVFGGDHANAVGVWNGVRSARLKRSPLPMGLIWIDAHMDGHIPETSPSGAWHGMPVASLLGYGEPEMACLLGNRPVLSPEHLVFIGVRSFEEGEAALLEKLNVKIYFIEEVKRRGLETVIQEALQRVTKNTGGFGVSLDLDVVDPQDAPGVGSPEPGGVGAEELLSALPLLGQDPRLLALEMVEYNPLRDIGFKTRDLIRDVLKSSFLETVTYSGFERF